MGIFLVVFMSNIVEQLSPGRIWREKKENRLIKIIRDDDRVIYWTYCNEAGEPEPHGFEKANGFTYDDWYDHCCDGYDFTVWSRFEFVR